MMKNWIDGLVRFGIVRKAGIVNTEDKSYLFIHPAIDHEWPNEIKLNVENLVRVATEELPDEVNLLTNNAPIVYRILYKAAPEDLAKYFIDIDIALGNQLLNYITENVPDSLVYSTFLGLLVSIAYQKALPFFAPLWSVYKEGSE